MMKSVFCKYFLLSGVALGSLTIAAHSAHAQPATASPWIVGGQLQGQYIYEENRDLGTDTDNPADSFMLDARARVTYRPTDTFMAFFEGSGVKTWGSASGEDDTGVVRPSGDYLELRQTWAKFSELFGIIPLDLQIGRQRIREEYGMWWNRDLDAVRLNYNTTLLSGFLGVADELATYRSADDRLDADLDDRLRVMFEASQVLTYGHKLQFRALYEHDRSGTGDAGDTVDAFDFDTEDQDILWTGLRSVGTHTPTNTSGLFGALNYRVDAIVAAGSEDMVTTAATADPEVRVVTDVDNRDVLGWAFDAGADVALNAPLQPRLIFGYAYGSGDDGEGTDTAFRQSDIQGNSSRLGLSTASMHNYGEVLRPELSNLHILSAGLGLPILRNSDITMIYRQYWLDKEESGLRSARVRDSVTGTDSDVGRELDLVANFNLNDEIPAFNTVPADTDLRVSVGTFEAGEAYGDAEGENMSRALVQLRMKF